jgi:hypothetical protein
MLNIAVSPEQTASAVADGERKTVTALQCTTPLTLLCPNCHIENRPGFKQA